jgi:predicted DNA-binding transcriptional regulator AlpA
MKSFQMGRLATPGLPKSTIFRLVVDEIAFRLPRNEHTGFRLLGDEIS